jgi:squalene-hopene/tetraprenyl-beta-curcumene cyclase
MFKKSNLCGVVVLSALMVAVARAETPAEKNQAAIDKALAYLVQQQNADGSFQKNEKEPSAITALVVRALAADPKYGPASEPVKKGADYLLTLQQKDGSIQNGAVPNYNTAVSISALAKLEDAKYKDAVAKAVAYLKSSQFTSEDTSGSGKNSQDGGWNYGGPRGGLADLSNTAMVLDALKESGMKEDDPTYKKALEFISRVQNHSETNSSEWAGNDGGMIYGPGAKGEGNSPAGEVKDDQGKRRLRSYGAMTYAGLKSMLHAGLSKDDARVRAAWQWIRSNWTLEENPGMGLGKPGDAKSGLFYYYFTLAHALDAYDSPNVDEPDGKKSHDWRVELTDKLASVQKEDGSFLGTQSFMENNPLIATSLATLALEDARKDLKEHPAK